MHMSLRYVHKEQNTPNIHTIKTSFRLSAPSSDGASPGVGLTADQGGSLWLTSEAPREALQPDR